MVQFGIGVDFVFFQQTMDERGSHGS
jgi:hypothetical protein